MKNLDFNDFLQSTNGLKPAIVDESTFDSIYHKATTSASLGGYLNLRLIKFVAAAVFLLVALNLFSIIKFTSANNRTIHTESASKQLADDFNFNR